MIDQVIETIKSYKANTSGAKRQSAIMLPLIYKDGMWQVLYELRSKNLKTQPGEICFPGGTLEVHEDSKEAAIRETCEELGVSASDFEIIGQMDSIMTSFDMLIHCYVGIITCPFESLAHATDEVEDIFTVPLVHLVEQTPKTYTAKSKFELTEDFPFQSIPNGKDYNFKTSSYPIVFYSFENHTIWGLTARIDRKSTRLNSSHH